MTLTARHPLTTEHKHGCEVEFVRDQTEEQESSSNSSFFGYIRDQSPCAPSLFGLVGRYRYAETEMSAHVSGKAADRSSASAHAVIRPMKDLFTCRTNSARAEHVNFDRGFRTWLCANRKSQIGLAVGTSFVEEPFLL